MKNLLLTFAFSTVLIADLFGQTDTTVTISDKIKMERDNELNSYKNELKENDNEIKRLQDKLF